jgi:uncharacterized tellurite resistance protein B-like protein
MVSSSFEKLLLQTALCCMASDGNIDKREITSIKNICENSSLFRSKNYQEELNSLVVKLISRGKEFFSSYFSLLKNFSLSEKEEIAIIDIAFKTIFADEVVDYQEIRFFKEIRKYLSISNERILQEFPEAGQFLEEDIEIESYVEKLTLEYLEDLEGRKFEFVPTFNVDALKIKIHKGDKLNFT